MQIIRAHWNIGGGYGLLEYGFNDPTFTPLDESKDGPVGKLSQAVTLLAEAPTLRELSRSVEKWRPELLLFYLPGLDPDHQADIDWFTNWLVEALPDTEVLAPVPKDEDPGFDPEKGCGRPLSQTDKSICGKDGVVCATCARLRFS